MLLRVVKVCMVTIWTNQISYNIQLKSTQKVTNYVSSSTILKLDSVKVAAHDQFIAWIQGHNIVNLSKY